jgi:FMN-dependent NADH-azoreductase
LSPPNTSSEESMPTLLHVDASPLSEHSITRRLSSEFVEGWRLANPHGEVMTRDLTTTKFTGIDAQWVQAVYSAPDSRTPEQNQLLALSDSLIAELERADDGSSVFRCTTSHAHGLSTLA